jgi:Na+-translocating ferredoxin:NAD+ oxidoreductase RnfG subunit
MSDAVGIALTACIGSVVTAAMTFITQVTVRRAARNSKQAMSEIVISSRCKFNVDGECTRPEGHPHATEK